MEFAILFYFHKEVCCDVIFDTLTSAKISSIHSFKRMGQHDSEPTGKRYRRGAAVKYRHPKFHVASMPEDLASIKRRTCPSTEKQQLMSALKEAKMTQSEVNSETLELKSLISSLKKQVADCMEKASTEAKHVLQVEGRNNVVKPVDNAASQPLKDACHLSAAHSKPCIYSDLLMDIVHTLGLDNPDSSHMLIDAAEFKQPQSGVVVAV